MNVKMFYHSLVSDWNHGNAHFLRGIVSELLSRSKIVEVYEPENSWSRTNLINIYGKNALNKFYQYYPQLNSIWYNLKTINLKEILNNADLVIVHEWNEPELVNSIGEYRKSHDNFRLLFHDTHHRAVTDKAGMKKFDFTNYDGIIVYGKVIKDIYLKEKWHDKVWIWHEAADTRIFHPYPKEKLEGDIVWIGNWGDEERTEELYEFLVKPVKELNLKCRVYGVRYPEAALKILSEAGIEYGGWLSNYKVPEVFSKYKITIHIPRRPYVKLLPGIPTIRPFEALACGIPLISSYWQDKEKLFKAGKDFIMVKDGKEMIDAIKLLLSDEKLYAELSYNGLNTVLNKHTCSHRVNELYKICEDIWLGSRASAVNF